MISSQPVHSHPAIISSNSTEFFFKSVVYAPKGATSVSSTSATDWQMAIRWDNVISISLRQV